MNIAVPLVEPQRGGSGLTKSGGTIALFRLWGPGQVSSQTPVTPHLVKTLGARLGVVRNPEACVSEGATVQTPPWAPEPHQ
jgi:hypothetical protein